MAVGLSPRSPISPLDRYYYRYDDSTWVSILNEGTIDINFDLISGIALGRLTIWIAAMLLRLRGTVLSSVIRRAATGIGKGLPWITPFTSLWLYKCHWCLKRVVAALLEMSSLTDESIEFWLTSIPKMPILVSTHRSLAANTSLVHNQTMVICD